LPKEKKGADLNVIKKDGQQIKGKLISVKKDSLLLSETEAQNDISIDIKDIGFIKIKRKQKTLTGAGIGLLLGIGLGFAVADRNDLEAGIRDLAVTSVSLSLLGVLMSNVASKETINLRGKSDRGINEFMEKLRKEARVPDFN